MTSISTRERYNATQLTESMRAVLLSHLLQQSARRRSRLIL